MLQEKVVCLENPAAIRHELHRDTVRSVLVSAFLTVGIAVLLLGNRFFPVFGSTIWTGYSLSNSFWYSLGVVIVLSALSSIGFNRLFLRGLHQSEALPSLDYAVKSLEDDLHDLGLARDSLSGSENPPPNPFDLPGFRPPFTPQIPDPENRPPSETEKRLEAENRELKQKLLTEQKFNDMMFTFIRAEHSRSKVNEAELLKAFADFLGSEFCAIYTPNGQIGYYDLYSFWSATAGLNPQERGLANINPERFEWSATRALAGKLAIFERSMLDKILRANIGLDKNSRDWLDSKVNECMEYKLCKDNNWSYLLSIPCIYEDSVQCIILIGLKPLEPSPLQLNEGRLLSAGSFLTRAMRIHSRPPVVQEDEKDRIKAIKLEAVSSLSAGLAHDFNNILTAILANISLALDELPEGNELKDILKAAEDSTLKGKVLTDHLLTFANGRPPEPSDSEMVTMLKTHVGKALQGSDVTSQYDIPADLPAMNISSEALGKVIFNLVQNALEAMGEEGILNLSACSDGTEICIKLTDTGEGIDPSNLSKIYDPYWTTRKEKRGLGLTIVSSILKKYHGKIRISSQIGKGTEVEIRIPSMDSTANLSKNYQIQSIPAESNKLLLMDENAFQKALVEALQRKNLNVIETSDYKAIYQLYNEARIKSNPLTNIIIDFDFYDWEQVQPAIDQILSSIPTPILIALKTKITPDDIKFFRKAGFSEIFGKPFHIGELNNLLSKFIS